MALNPKNNIALSSYLNFIRYETDIAGNVKTQEKEQPKGLLARKNGMKKQAMKAPSNATQWDIVYQHVKKIRETIGGKE